MFVVDEAAATAIPHHRQLEASAHGQANACAPGEATR
jgi:hypothetical protein